MNPRQVLQELRRTLHNLSAGPDDQIKYLLTLGQLSVDELALEYDEALRLVWIRQASRPFTELQLKELNGVGAMLREISGDGHSELWTVDGLRSAPEWEAVRSAAKRALYELVHSSC